MIRTRLIVALVLVALSAIACTVLGGRDIHVVTFNDTARIFIDVAIRLDNKLVLWGAAATPNREPKVAFDLPVRLARGTHRLTVLAGPLRKDVVIQVQQETTVEIGLRDHEIIVDVIQGQRLYL